MLGRQIGGFAWIGAQVEPFVHCRRWGFFPGSVSIVPAIQSFEAHPNRRSLAGRCKEDGTRAFPVGLVLEHEELPDSVESGFTGKWNTERIQNGRQIVSGHARLVRHPAGPNHSPGPRPSLEPRAVQTTRNQTPPVTIRTPAPARPLQSSGWPVAARGQLEIRASLRSSATFRREPSGDRCRGKTVRLPAGDRTLANRWRSR